MTPSHSRRQFLTTTSLATATALTGSRATGKDTETATVSLEGRIFKAVKGGKKRNESPLEFFTRLKNLGFDGVESGNAKQAADYAKASAGDWRDVSWNGLRLALGHAA